jgi:hypothetical protein
MTLTQCCLLTSCQQHGTPPRWERWDQETLWPSGEQDQVRDRINLLHTHWEASS